MTFLNPSNLWLFLGILVPVAIHLWSRHKVVTIKVGSIRFLQESEPKSTSTLRLNELWLLVLRVLTITILVLLLASPRIVANESRVSLLYLIEPSLLSHDGVKRLLNETPAEQVKVLSEGFPELARFTAENEANDIPDYWQLAQKMDALAADSIVVLAAGFVSGIKGKRPTVPRRVSWTLMPTEDASSRLLEVTRVGDSLKLLSMVSDRDERYFKREKRSYNEVQIIRSGAVDSVVIEGITVPIRLQKPIKIHLRSHDSLFQVQHYLSAAFRAVAKLTQRTLVLDENSEEGTIDWETYDLCVWLGIRPQDNIKTKQLIFEPDPLSQTLIKPTADKHIYVLTDYLNSENIFSEHLAEQLHTLLHSNEDLEALMRTHDRRVADYAELRPNLKESGRKAQKAGLVDPSPWLWTFLFVILILERLLAKYRKQ